MPSPFLCFFILNYSRRQHVFESTQEITAAACVENDRLEGHEYHCEKEILLLMRQRWQIVTGEFIWKILPMIQLAGGTIERPLSLTCRNRMHGNRETSTYGCHL